MTNFQQAHVLLMQHGRWMPDGETPRFPHTDLDINTTVSKDRYGYNDVYLSLPNTTVHLVFDNHFVGLHAPGESGKKLKLYEQELNELLIGRPEYTEIATQNWGSNDSYRVGYQFNSHMKALPDFQKVFLIYQAMMDVMAAAEQFSQDRVKSRHKPLNQG